MPWTELKTRRWPAFDKDLDGISKETMEDHFKLYEGYAKKANECRKLLTDFDYSEIEGNQPRSSGSKDVRRPVSQRAEARGWLQQPTPDAPPA